VKKISLLHTVRAVYENFGTNLREAMPGVELEIMNTVDEFLAADAKIHGFTQDNKTRLLHILQAKDLESADIIVVTCSTLTPAVEEIRPLLSTPLVAIDDEMAEHAVRAGERIVLMATAASALEPGARKLHIEAAKIGREIKLERIHCPAAFDAILRMDREAHDRILIEAAQGVKDADVLVLAQASMAHVEKNIEDLSGIKTLSSPRLCFGRIKRMLQA
jgi:aspartate/glutamate racemase